MKSSGELFPWLVNAEDEFLDRGYVHLYEGPLVEQGNRITFF